MTANGWVQIVLYFVVLTALVVPLGRFMARVFEGERTFLSPVFRPVEAVSIGPPASTKRASSTGSPIRSPCSSSMPRGSFWSTRCNASRRCCRSILRAWPPSPDLAFNTAVSFTSNTNWQNYGGESTMSYLTQMAALTTQNFVSAATGIALASR